MPPAGQELFAVEALAGAGARATDRHGGRLVAYFPEPGGGESSEAADRVAGDVAVRILGATSLSDPDVRWWWTTSDAVPGPRERTAPGGVVRISPGLAVAETEEEAPEEGGRVVRLQPGLGFGDARHPTTRAALAHLEAVVAGGEKVLDLGSGSGVLAVAAALLGAERVLAVDRDEYACRAAARNAEVNGVMDRVEVRRRAVAAGDLRGEGPFDGILANVVPGILGPLLPDLHSVLRADGWLVVAGASGRERDDVLGQAEGCGFVAEREDRLEGWWSCVFRAPQSPGPDPSPPV